MKLIVDSGSTKTDWRLIHNHDSISQFESIGLNPLIVTQETVRNALEKLVIPYEEVRQIYFYGAGCENLDNIQWLAEILASFFINSTIYIHSDLLASAHALLGNKSGFIGILGTGSNAAFFDGKDIKLLTPSLGYLIGDEGSGNALGKKFLKCYLSGSMDLEIAHNIKYDKKVILSELYSHPFPNRYLASFSKIIFQFRRYPQIQSMIYESFHEFIDIYLTPFSISSISLTGSIAYFFSDEIKYCCQQKGIKVNAIMEKPISALTRYHLEYH